MVVILIIVRSVYIWQKHIWLLCIRQSSVHCKEVFFFSGRLNLCCMAAIILLISCSIVSDSWQPRRLQHARFPCPSLSSGVCSVSFPLSWWCHLIISTSVTPFSSCLNALYMYLLYRTGESCPLYRKRKSWRFEKLSNSSYTANKWWRETWNPVLIS